jgi:hypothetical protein
MMDKSCCDDQGHDCLQSDACPIYKQRRRVRAGQPAPPVFLDPVDIDDEPSDMPLSDAKAALVVLVIMVLAFVGTAVLVGAV